MKLVVEVIGLASGLRKDHNYAVQQLVVKYCSVQCPNNTNKNICMYRNSYIMECLGVSKGKWFIDRGKGECDRPCSY